MVTTLPRWRLHASKALWILPFGVLGFTAAVPMTFAASVMPG